MSAEGDVGVARWAARPTVARVVRTVVFLAPVAASVGVASLAHLALGAAGSRAEQAGHLAVLLAVSTLTLFAVDRLARRALPLATLLELSMLFPDRAPSRLALARDAIRRRPVEEQLARVREAGADPALAAREILQLVAALRVHDRPTRGHAERVRMLTDLVAESMKLSNRDRDLLRWAAILHDIGKLRVSPLILNKPGKPTDDEWAVLRAHPAHGAEIASALLPWLGEWGDVIVQHHERYDGTGYPAGLAGRQISLGGRIVAVADAYEVMTATRAYRRPVSRAAAHRELVKWSGRQFDPAVVRAMVSLSAPRLRRAQGVLSWLGDMPFVAASYVPATTVARVVGASALATGAATGVGLPMAVSSAAPAQPDPGRVSSSAAPVVPAPTTPKVNGDVARDHAKPGKPDPTSPQPDPHADVAAPPLAAGRDGAAAAPVAPAASTAAKPERDDPPPAAAPKKPEATGGSGSASSGSGSSGSSNSGSGSSGSGSSGSGSGSDPVGAVVTTTVDAVTGTVTGTVGAVTDIVGSTVGAVTGTVGSVVGALTGVLTGNGSGSSGSGSGSSGSGSGSSGSSSGNGGGLLGGLLGGGKGKH